MKKTRYRITAVLLAVWMLLVLLPTAAFAADAEESPVGFHVEGATELPGHFYISFVYSRDLLLLDGCGNLVWSKHEEQPAEGLTTGMWDFKKHEIDGKTYYSYHDQTGTYDDYGLPGFAPGERVILDDGFREIKRITFEASEVTEKGHPVDGHDFLMIGPDHYILSGYIRDTVYNVPGYPEGSVVVYSYLQEVEDGEAVWDWKSVDYPELYALTATDASATADDFGNLVTDTPDYVHFNAMRLDGEGNLICSFRHLNTILCLDRSKEEDAILWKLSGAADEFGLTDEQKTSGQHYVTLDGDSITVFDNNNRGRETRVLSYTVDTADRTTELVRSYSFPEKFSVACGSAQRIGGGLYCIGWGWTTRDAECLSVYDLSAGEKLLSVTLDDPEVITYRCVYYD